MIIKKLKDYDPYYNKISLEFEIPVSEENLFEVFDICKKIGPVYLEAEQLRGYFKNNNILQFDHLNLDVLLKKHSIVFDVDLSIDFKSWDIPLEIKFRNFILKKKEINKLVSTIDSVISLEKDSKSFRDCGIHINYNFNMFPAIIDIVKNNQHLFDYHAEYRRKKDIFDPLILNIKENEKIKKREKYNFLSFYNLYIDNFSPRIELRCLNTSPEAPEKLEKILFSSKSIVEKYQKDYMLNTVLKADFEEIFEVSFNNNEKYITFEIDTLNFDFGAISMSEKKWKEKFCFSFLF